MKAAVLFETKGKLSVENVDISEPKKDEVLVKIKASGLCHTDWETMHGYQPVNLPAIIGHEGAGVVEAVGAKGVGLALGVGLVAQAEEDQLETVQGARFGHVQLDGPVLRHLVCDVAGGAVDSRRLAGFKVQVLNGAVPVIQISSKYKFCTESYRSFKLVQSTSFEWSVTCPLIFNFSVMSRALPVQIIY